MKRLKEPPGTNTTDISACRTCYNRGSYDTGIGPDCLACMEKGERLKKEKREKEIEEKTKNVLR